MASKSQVRRIKEWRPTFGKSFNVMIEGYLEGDKTKKLWRSSVIEYRDGPKTLVTKTGVNYVLVGSINKKVCIERGFSNYVIQMFVDGFPEDWRDLLYTQYTDITQNMANFATTTAKNNDIDHDFDFSTPPRTTKKKETKAVVPYKTTPNTVATTKSGRVVKPRIATWANQDIVYDKDGSVIEVRNPTTTTRQSKKVNQNLDKLCSAIGVDTPESSQIFEKSAKSPQQRSVEKPKNKKKQKKNLVGYSSSEYDSIDNESSDGIELLETGNTPIRPSKQVAKLIQRRNRILESSSEDEEEEEEREVPIKKEKSRRKRPATSSSTNDVPNKKGKKKEPVCKLKLKKAPEQILSPTPVDFDDDPYVEFPESDKENDKRAPKKWTEDEKKRFLEILKHCNPVDDYGWKEVHDNKSDRTIEEMKEKAKELKWKPRGVASKAEEIQIKEVTAKPGTVAHIMQANQANQNYLAAKNKNTEGDSCRQRLRDPNMLNIPLNDSVLSILRTPENPKHHRIRYAPQMEINLDGTSDSLNDSSKLSTTSSTSCSFFFPQSEKSRRQLQKTGIQILTKQNTNSRNFVQNRTMFTETNTTTMNFMLPQFLQRQNIPRIEESADEEEEEEDDEIEDEEE